VKVEQPLVAASGGTEHLRDRLWARPRRVGEHERRHEVHRERERARHLEPRLRILAREVANLVRRPARVLPDRDRGTGVLIEVDVVRVGLDLAQPVALQVQIGLDRARAEERGLDRPLVDPVIWGSLDDRIGREHAADRRRGLDDQRLQAGLLEVAGGHQAVVAGADHNHVGSAAAITVAARVHLDLLGSSGSRRYTRGRDRG
jgi:hypothetical protein